MRGFLSFSFCLFLRRDWPFLRRADWKNTNKRKSLSARNFFVTCQWCAGVPNSSFIDFEIHYYIQSFTGPCNTPAHCNTGATELATDTHLNFFDWNNVWYCPNTVCIQFWAITHLCAKVMKVFSNKFAVFSCFWNLLEHFWPHKYSTSIVRYTLVHYRYDNTYKLLKCARISVEIDGFVASKAH